MASDALGTLGREVARQRGVAYGQAASEAWHPLTQASLWQQAELGRRNAAGLGGSVTGVGAVLDALVGAEALARRRGQRFRMDWRGFGRAKGVDPVTGQTIDLRVGRPSLHGLRAALEDQS